jgi:hypothetical protein
VKKSLSWFFEGFVKLLGASSAGVLLAHIQQVRELANRAFGLTIASPTAVWTTTASLCLASSVLVLIAYHLSRFRKKRAEIAAAAEAKKPTGAFSSASELMTGSDPDGIDFDDTPIE